MAQENPQQPRIAPPLKNVQYINTPVNMSPVDEDGTREISFVVTPVEQNSYTLVRGAQIDIVKIFVEEFTNDEKRELLDVLAPGIEVAQAVPEKLKK